MKLLRWLMETWLRVHEDYVSDKWLRDHVYRSGTGWR